jgi:nuclear GTP-binding protein
MKIRGRKSKRIPARKRYKIIKKVREHNRKVRKESRKHPEKFKKKRDAGVPNSCPFKADLLAAAQEHLRKEEEQRLALKALSPDERALTLSSRVQDTVIEAPASIDDTANGTRPTLGELASAAEHRAAEFELKQEILKLTKENKTGDDIVAGAFQATLRTYCKEFKRVIDSADVILEVLDARDPLATRSDQVERAVAQAGPNKRLILVLNKIDLIPRSVAERWLRYLRNEYPTIAFKSSVQHQRDNLGRAKLHLGKRKLSAGARDDPFGTSRCLGAEGLLELLANYSRFKGAKSGKERSTVVVGVVGFPNTGKSSIINSLKRTRVCTVGSTPGVTKVLQQVQLDRHVKLVDSPGIVVDPSCDHVAAMLRNCLRVESIADPSDYVEAIMQRVGREKLQIHYNLPAFTDATSFLELLAQRMGRLRKRGVPDTNSAGKRVLYDWNAGVIRYYTLPPAQHPSVDPEAARLLSTYGTEFDIDNVYSKDTCTFREIEQLVPASALDTALEGEGALSPLRAVLDASQMPQVAKRTLEEFYGRHKKEKQQQPGGRFAQLSKLRSQDGEDADEVEMAALDDDDQWEDVGDDDDDDDLDEVEDMEGDDEPAATIPKSARVQSSCGGGHTIKGKKVSPAKRARSEHVDELGMNVDEDQQRRPAYLDRVRGGQPTRAHASAGSERELTSNARVGRVRKSVLKQIQKRRRRSAKVASDLSDELERALA